jgi:uncharacterized BrkB/YihY/UPF0761 family membrane protein
MINSIVMIEQAVAGDSFIGAAVGGAIGAIVIGILLLLLVIIVIVVIGRMRNKKYDGSKGSSQNGGMVFTNAIYGIVYVA